MKLPWKMHSALKVNKCCQLTFCPSLPPCLCCASFLHPLAFHFFSMLITNLLQSETTATPTAAMTPHQKRELRQPKEWIAQKTEAWLIKADPSPLLISNFLSRACFSLAQKCAGTTPYEPTRLKVPARLDTAICQIVLFNLLWALNTVYADKWLQRLPLTL